MEYSNLLELIKTVSALNISGFQYEEGDTRIIITTGGNGLSGAVGAVSGGCSGANANPGAPMTAGILGTTSAVIEQGQSSMSGQVAVNAQSMVAMQSVAGAGQSVTTQTVTTTATAGNLVKSPLVGTFYAAPAEDAEPFVKVGDVVKKGQTLAIVEAMKLMNDIEAEYDGTILEILVENGATVEYGQPLFSIG